MRLLFVVVMSLLLRLAPALPFGGRKHMPRQCPLAERDALVSLYNAANGANWGIPWDVSSESDPCLHEWYGVACDREGHVRTLELVGNNLVGTLASSFGRLPKLHTLNLSDNQLTGPLPGSFTALTRLKFVNLSANHFIGPFPKGVADWVHLTLLEISNNDFDAPLPAEIEALPQQKGVNLSMESYKCKTATDKCRDYPGEVM